MTARLELSGQRFGRLTVLRCVGSRPGSTGALSVFWSVKCDCGKTFDTRASLLRRQTRSCGCVSTEKNISRSTHGAASGGRVTTEYNTWMGMIGRCHRETDPAFGSYGGRGISVCDAWRGSFAAFLADMGHKPTASHSLDRVNNDGNYEKTNCRWATRREQARNRRSSLVVHALGQSRLLVEWSELTGIPTGVLSGRLRAGWDADAAVSEPVGGPQATERRRAGNAKLTSDKALAIRSAVGSHAEVAIRFGISAGAVADVRSRKTWKHLDAVIP